MSYNSLNQEAKMQLKNWLESNPDWVLKTSKEDVAGNCILEKLTNA